MGKNNLITWPKISVSLTRRTTHKKICLRHSLPLCISSRPDQAPRTKRTTVSSLRCVLSLSLSLCLSSWPDHSKVKASIVSDRPKQRYVLCCFRSRFYLLLNRFGSRFYLLFNRFRSRIYISFLCMKFASSDLWLFFFFWNLQVC